MRPHGRLVPALQRLLSGFGEVAHLAVEQTTCGLVYPGNDLREPPTQRPDKMLPPRDTPHRAPLPSPNRNRLASRRRLVRRRAGRPASLPLKCTPAPGAGATASGAVACSALDNEFPGRHGGCT